MKKGFTHESTYNESKEWYTPKYIFDGLGLSFDLDPCSPGADLVPWIPAEKHLTVFEDGLTSPWNGLVFMNPPYGMDTPKWMRRLREHGNGIGLVFARPDTAWFHNYVPFADAILFVKGRVQFVPADRALEYHKGIYRPKGGCGAASMLVAYGEAAMHALIESELGWVFFPAEANVLPAGKNMETVVMDGASQVAATIANENLPRISESGQGILF